MPKNYGNQTFSLRPIDMNNSLSINWRYTGCLSTVAGCCWKNLSNLCCQSHVISNSRCHPAVIYFMKLCCVYSSCAKVNELCCNEAEIMFAIVVKQWYSWLVSRPTTLHCCASGQMTVK